MGRPKTYGIWGPAMGAPYKYTPTPPFAEVMLTFTGKAYRQGIALGKAKRSPAKQCGLVCLTWP